MSYLNPGRTVETGPEHDVLIAGSFPVNTIQVNIPAGAAIPRGTVMGRITSGGAYTGSLSAASDGSETPSAILMYDVAASGAARTGIIARTGEFAFQKLILGASHTRASIEQGLRALSIFFRDIQED
jgi:hypothetical protein